MRTLPTNALQTMKFMVSWNGAEREVFRGNTECLELSLYVLVVEDGKINKLDSQYRITYYPQLFISNQ